MRIFPLFPSALIQLTMEENINQLHKDAEKEKYHISTLANKAQGSDNCRILERYPRIKKSILNYFHQYSRDSLHYDGKFAITTSWFTKVEKGSSSDAHCHKNSFYSGVLYFNDYPPESGGKITLFNPLESFTDYQIISKEDSSYNARSFSISIRKNLLIFFPSYVFHQVETYTGNHLRYSLAFNIVPIGLYGHADSAYSTDWV